MKKLTPKQQALKEERIMKKAKAEAEKQAAKKADAVKIIKQVVEAYKEYRQYIAGKDKNVPMRGLATKALHTLLGTKIKQKAKICNHCGDKTNNKKSLCNKCLTIPLCKSCEIMLGNWNEDKTLLEYKIYNKPSLLDPLMCQQCYDRNN
jgi:hypothetical protein